MVSAEQYLAVLEQKGLLPRALLDGITSKLAQPSRQTNAVDVAHMLINAGYLTPVMANHLLEELEKQAVQNVQKPDSDEENLDFAQLQDDLYPRVVRKSMQAYKNEKPTEIYDLKAPHSDTPKPLDPSTVATKKTLLDKPAASPWSNSVYERETDSYKGLVSYRLAKLTEDEQYNPPEALPPEKDMSLFLTIFFICSFLIIIALLIWFFVC